MDADLYAVRSTRGPTAERAAAGCPATGWFHEGLPPWRVISARAPEDLAWLARIEGSQIAAYTGDEDTVDVRDRFPELFPRYAFERDPLTPGLRAVAFNAVGRALGPRFVPLSVRERIADGVLTAIHGVLYHDAAPYVENGGTDGR